MAKNRKNQSVAIRFGPALKALLLCSLFLLSGVGYVWQKSLIADLRLNIQARESALVKLKDRNKKLSSDLAGLRSPKQLNERLIGLKLGLGSPPEVQVWRLVEPAGPSTGRPAPAVQQYAARP